MYGQGNTLISADDYAFVGIAVLQNAILWKDLPSVENQKIIAFRGSR